MDIDEIKEIVKLFKDENLHVLDIQNDDQRIRLEAKPPFNPSTMQNSTTDAILPSNDRTQNKNQESVLNERIAVYSPQIGVFYTQPSEDSETTFVEVGDKVTADTQVGLIETMKLFNSIYAGATGVIDEILVNNGDPVEYKQIVMYIRPEEA